VPCEPVDALDNIEPQNSRIMNRRISKGGFATLSLFYKKDRIPSFDIRSALFDIRSLKFLLSIKLAASQAGGWADSELYSTVKFMCQVAKALKMHGCCTPL